MPETTVVNDDLAGLAARIRSCRLCVDEPHGTPLPHSPRPVFVESSTAKILIAGQAPGVRVHASGKPFTDPSGNRLRDWLGVTVEQFYDPRNFAIIPMGFCFPGLDRAGGDLPPRRECAPAWRDSLLDAMPQLKLVIAVGRYAQVWHLGNAVEANVTDTVRNWQSHASAQVPVYALPHPSWRNSGWLKHNPWFHENLLPMLKHEIQSQVC